MKSEEEIREEIKEMQKCLKKESGYLACENFGYIQALKWVLEEQQ